MRAQIEVAGVWLDPVDAPQAVARVHDALDVGRGGLLLTPNLQILRLLQRTELRPLAERADLVVCDGTPVLWASRLAGTPLPSRVTGADLIWLLSDEAAARGRSVFIIGGPPGAAQSALETLVGRYPGLRAAGSCSPPVGFDRDPSAMAALSAQLAEASPDLVFVCLGFPKQERVALALRPICPSTWFVGCGAAVEFVAGSKRRAPRWSQRVGGEWVHRLVQEPRRLGPRYAQDAVFGLRLVAGSLWTRGRATRKKMIDLREVEAAPEPLPAQEAK